MDAASLSAEALAAWNEYLEKAHADLQKRVGSGGQFLWTLESPDRAERVRKGEIVVEPAPGLNPQRVPGGLIHHWKGAMFLANVKLDHVVEVMRDYNHYKDYYSPSVAESKVIAYNGREDDFSLVMTNRAYIVKTALKATYHSISVRVDDHRSYSISDATSIQGIEGYGQRNEHVSKESESGSYVWRIHSLARMKQEGSGVIYEFEAIALSRDIPAALRFFVEPIVRRMSRDSLLTSLQKTADAIRRKPMSSPVPMTSSK